MRWMMLFVILALEMPFAVFAAAPPRAVRHDTPTTLSCVYCYGWIRTNADGSLNQCQLAADTAFGGLRLPKDTTVWFYKGGTKPWRTWLSKAMAIQGVPCYGARHAMVDTCFYPSGKLQVTFLAEPTTIQGIPCKKSGLCPVYLFESGKLKQCTLDQAATVGGQPYPKDLILFFDEAGKVVKTDKMRTTWQIMGQIVGGLFGGKKGAKSQ